MPYRDLPRHTPDELLERWARLHGGQGSFPPPEPGLVAGWLCYHHGDFEQAAAHGLRHGGVGQPLLDQATCVYADYLEPREALRLQLFRQVAERSALRMAADPQDCHALYWQAYALARYSQGISVARALAQGLAGRIKLALERVIELQPGHADAHIALGAFHAEVIDKVGALVARMTYGANADTALALFERGLALRPDSPGALTDFGRGLLMLRGSEGMAEATRLYERAAALRPADARERLDVELARAGLED
ncbi:MAG: hypothetical protein EOO24_00400 [Comamonadaceae bacterium]|nr:MAG: hypothetical protein EOO24_00400 [Comamonadaceae bacterium]